MMQSISSVVRVRWLGLLLLLTASACGESSTGPVADPPDPALDALLSSSLTAPGADGGPLLGRLLRLALARVSEESGPEAARAVHARLALLEGAVREARAAGDVEGYRAAVLALETQTAQVVVRVFSPTVVRRTLSHANESVTRFRERVRAAAAAGGDVTNARALLQRATSSVEAAQKAAAGGDLPAALRHAARALDLLGGIG